MGEIIRKSQEKRKRQIIRRCLVAGVLAVAIMIGALYHFNIIPHQYYYNGDFGIVTYKSNVDFDNDGIDGHFRRGEKIHRDKSTI